MRFLWKVCAFFFAAGLLSLALATANEVLNLGIWHDDYPSIFTFDEGRQVEVPVSYGRFMLEFGAITLGALLLGTFLHWRLRVREADLVAWVESMDDEERREFLADLEEEHS
jgi:hypothetical protein